MPVQTISTLPTLQAFGSSELTQRRRVRASRGPGSNALPASPCNDGPSQGVHGDLMLIHGHGGVHSDAPLPLVDVVGGILAAVGEHESPIHVVLHKRCCGNFSHARVVGWDGCTDGHLDSLVLVSLWDASLRPPLVSN
jgi:hypothetical protein